VLGQPYAVPVGAFYLAWRSGAALHPIHTTRDPDRAGRYVAAIGEVVDVDRSAPMGAALEAGADFTADWLSLLLGRHPGDWHFWDGFAPGGLIR